MNAKSSRCPRFDSCNANICPLDPQWPRAQHLKGEAVCGLLSELVKVGGRQRLEGRLTGDQLATLVREWPKIEARWGSIRAQLKRAALSGSKLESMQALRRGVPCDNLMQLQASGKTAHTDAAAVPL
jgi:hypothetical protein